MYRKKYILQNINFNIVEITLDVKVEITYVYSSKKSEG